MNHMSIVVVGLLLTFTASGVKAAEGAYPNRPVRFIVPFAPGGPSDILSRFVGQKLGDALGETIVVDNRGSVGGILGAELASEAAPDGYTLLLAANSLLTINPHVYKKLPYDPQRDFQPITQFTEGGNVVVVHPSVPAKSITELVKIVNLPDVQGRFKEQGLTPVGSKPEEVSAHIKEESLEVAKLVKQIGYQPQ